MSTEYALSQEKFLGCRSYNRLHWKWRSDIDNHQSRPLLDRGQWC